MTLPDSIRIEVEVPRQWAEGIVNYDRILEGHHKNGRSSAAADFKWHTTQQMLTVLQGPCRHALTNAAGAVPAQSTDATERKDALLPSTEETR